MEDSHNEALKKKWRLVLLEENRDPIVSQVELT